MFAMGRHLPKQSADGRAEVEDQGFELALPRLGSGGSRFDGLQEIVAFNEPLSQFADRIGHLADLVGALHIRHIGVEIASRKLFQ